MTMAAEHCRWIAEERVSQIRVGKFRCQGGRSFFFQHKFAGAIKRNINTVMTKHIDATKIMAPNDSSNENGTLICCM